MPAFATCPAIPQRRMVHLYCHRTIVGADIMMKLLTPEAALALADRHWRVGGEVEALPSYLDQNFRIRGEAGDFVLKVAHPSWSRAELDLENRAMMTLAERAPELAWPRVQVTPEGEHLLAVTLEGQRCHVRLLAFVPGQTYAAVVGTLSAAQRHVLQENLGAAVGAMTRGLAGFGHLAAERPHPWNLLRLPELLPQLAFIGDRALRAVVAAQAEAFCKCLPGWLKRLPITVVHNDPNDLNVIVGQDDDGFWCVRSIIDFGDMCTSFRLADLAIACTYAMQHADDPVACARDLVRGYVSRAPLMRVELELLHAFILARVCQSILMATRARREQPDNAFVLVSQPGMRTLLSALASLPPRTIVEPFLEYAHG